MHKPELSVLEKIESLPYSIRLTVCAVVWALYLLVMVFIGATLFPFAVLPVILCGWLLGVQAGLVSGLISLPLNLIANTLNGGDMPNMAQQVFFVFTLAVTGVLVGRLYNIQPRLVKEISHRKQIEESLKIERDLVAAIGNGRDVETALDILLETISQMEGISCCAVYQVNPENGSLMLLGYRKLPEEMLQGIKAFEPGTLPARLAGTDKAVYRSLDASGGESFDASFIPGGRALAVLPIRQGSHPKEVLIAASYTFDSFPDAIRHILETGVAQIEEIRARHEAEERLSRGTHDRTRAEHTLQVINEELLHTVAELEQQNLEITLMNDMSGLLQSCLNPDEVYRVLLRSVKELLPEFPGALYLYNKETHNLELNQIWGGMDTSRQIFVPEACLALRRWRVYFVTDPETTIRCEHFDKMPSSYVCAPLVAQDETYGLLYLEGKDGLLNRRYEYLITMMAERSALMLKNLELTQTLLMQATRDSLTGLNNYRYLGEALERELRRASRHKLSLGVVMLDLDQFKRINDTLGHGTGDVVLREIGRFLQANIRSEDVACRYGGDEFVLILTQTALEGCTKRAEQLRADFKDMKISQGDVVITPGTVSVGVAVYPDHGNAVQELLLAADLALYHAKSNGKDQVVVAKRIE